MGAMFSFPSLAQGQHFSTLETSQAFWTLSATASEESIGQGLPVLALDRDDWPLHRSGQASQPRAWRGLQAELSATHPSGWRFGALARAEAWLQASPDAVTVAALDTMNSRPEAARNYDLNASSQSWQGHGLRVGTPWLKLDTSDRWRWQADVQLLRLQKFRTVDLSGNLSYQSSNVYDFNVHSQRSNSNINDPYLSASGRSGLASSLSVAVQGEPAAGWQVLLRADDLLSRLDWSELATDTAQLNSQVTNRAPDGSLDYAPLVMGQKTLTHVTRRIGVHWQAKVNWSAFKSHNQLGAISLQLNRRAGLNQVWLGWESSNNGRNGPRWSFALEPVRRVASMGLEWHGWQALLATDGRGSNSEFRYLRLGWRGEF